MASATRANYKVVRTLDLALVTLGSTGRGDPNLHFRAEILRDSIKGGLYLTRGFRSERLELSSKSSATPANEIEALVVEDFIFSDDSLKGNSVRALESKILWNIEHRLSPTDSPQLVKCQPPRRFIKSLEFSAPPIRLTSKLLPSFRLDILEEPVSSALGVQFYRLLPLSLKLRFPETAKLSRKEQYFYVRDSSLDFAVDHMSNKEIVDRAASVLSQRSPAESDALSAKEIVSTIELVSPFSSHAEGSRLRIELLQGRDDRTLFEANLLRSRRFITRPTLYASDKEWTHELFFLEERLGPLVSRSQQKALSEFITYAQATSAR